MDLKYAYELALDHAEKMALIWLANPTEENKIAMIAAEIIEEEFVKKLREIGQPLTLGVAS